jgi:hypothetical protein
VRAALIPPKGYYKTATTSNYHLVLAQINDPEYFRTYAYLDDSHYVILDNGAAEGGSVSDKNLLSVAVAIGVDEVVVPDVIGDMQATIDRVDNFFKENEQFLGGAKFMAVAQGQAPSEIYRCLDHYWNNYPGIVVGLPRHLLTTFNLDRARIGILNHIERETEGQAQVHLLGTNPKWPSEIKHIANIYPWVRGVDSSMPYNWTMARNELGDEGTVARPENYFTEERDLDSALLEHNVNTYMRWASGTEGTSR